MKKNIWVIFAILFMVAICGYIGALIFRPEFVQPITDLFVNLKNQKVAEGRRGSVMSGETLIIEPKDGGPNCGGLKGGCADVVKNIDENIEEAAKSDFNTPEAVELSESQEKILDTGMTEKEILAKIDENTKKQQEIENASTKTLIQGDYKAEYFPSKDYTKDTDKIIVTIAGKKYEIPGVYGKEVVNRYTKFIHSEGQQFMSDKPQDWYILIDSKYYPVPSSGNAVMAKEFMGFGEFSPSGTYLLYFVGWYEYGATLMVDAKTGKEVFNILEMGPFTWTNDRKRFIYGSSGWMASGPWLHITKTWAFPEFADIQDKNGVEWLYADEKYVYSQEDPYDENKKYLKIYDLKTLKEVYSKELPGSSNN